MEGGRGNDLPKQPDQPRLKAQQMAGPLSPQRCPRCNSSNTKFCYYNNYSLTQPRYFCKNCRRYWTHGGTLRNVPVGGGYRNSKRPKTDQDSTSGAAAEAEQPVLAAIPPQTLAALSAGHVPSMRPLHPGVGGTYFRSGAFLSSLAAMQSMAPGTGQFDGINLRPQGPPPPPPPQQFPLQNNQYFHSQDSLANPPRPPWPQAFINNIRGPAAPATTSSAGTSLSFWTGDVDGDSDDQAGPSFNPGFDPSSP